MKKGLFAIFLIAVCVLLSECKKDPISDVFRVTEVDVGESDFHVNISNLKTGTKYYYCFECYSSYSTTRSEVHSFMTLEAEKPIVETGVVENITLDFASSVIRSPRLRIKRNASDSFNSFSSGI